MDTIKAMIEEHKIIVICRGVYNDTLLKTMEALYKGGIRLAEVSEVTIIRIRWIPFGC